MNADSPEDFANFLNALRGSKSPEEAAASLGITTKRLAQQAMYFRALGLLWIGPATYLVLRSYINEETT